MAGAKLFPRDASHVHGTLATRLRQQRVAHRPIAVAAPLPEATLLARALARQPAPRVATLAAVRAPESVLVTRLAQRRERRRVAPALRKAVPPKPELMRP